MQLNHQPCSIPQSLSRSLRRAPVLSPEEETAIASTAWLAREEAWGLVLGDRDAAEASVLAARDLARGDGGEVSKATAAARRVLLDAISVGEVGRIARADKDDVVLREVIALMPDAVAARARSCIVRLDAAVRKLERHNVMLVLHVIRCRFRGWLGGEDGRGSGAEFEVGDLLGFGMLGLRVAVMRFDPRRGFRFSTFATHWISHAIRREIQDTRFRVRLPVHVQDKMGVVGRTSDALRAAGLPADPEAIASRMGTLSAAQVQAVLAARALNSGPSLHLLVRGVDGDDSQEYADLVPDLDSASENDIVEAMDAGRRVAALRSALSDLDARERLVVEMRAGLRGAAKPAILAEVGEVVGLSRQRVQQIERAALGVLRRSVEAKITMPQSPRRP